MPLSPTAGYVFLRGALNSGFDPNPWSLSFGYTIPLSTMAKLAAAAL